MRKALVIAVALMLSGCHLFDSSGRPGTGPQTPPDGGVIVTPPLPPETDPDIPPVPVPQTINWPVSMEAVAEKMIQGPVVQRSDVLLIDDVRNNSNVDLNTATLTSQLKQTVVSTNRFSAVAEEQLSAARQALGLQSEDSLNSRSKTIGLARYLSAPYILYTTIEGQNPDLSLSSQIMQVQTGELIWSERTPVRLD